jgi:hypothetical protein
MIPKRAIASILGSAMLGGFMLTAPAFAAPQNETGFAALQGVEAQALSVEEMQAISGELNAYDIAHALYAKGLRGLAGFYYKYADQINRVFKALDIYTDCRTC